MHRGRAPLFAEIQRVYQGYRTHKPGSFTWPFSFDLPVHPDLSAVTASKHQWPERDHFLSTEDYVPGHPMPPTFRMRKWGLGFRWHAFIEYVLQVEVKEADGASMVLPASLRKAVKPIIVKQLHENSSGQTSLPMGVQFTIPEQLDSKMQLERATSKQPQLQKQVSRLTIRSSELSNWSRERKSHLSFANSVKDKARSVFSSNAIPAFTFDFHVAVPKQIMLLSDDAIPIVVNAVPVTDSELTTIQRENYPDVRINNLTLDIIASTYIRFKSIFPSHSKTKHEIRLLDRARVDHTFDMKQHRDSSLASKDKTSLSTGQGEVVADSGCDLSQLPGLNLALTSAKLGKQQEMPLSPTFNTYIIAREYTIVWRMELEVAAERLKVSSDDKIRVIVKPPQEDDLNVFLSTAELTKEKTNDSKVEGESDAESDDVTSDIKGGRPKLLPKLKRRSKQQEASEEATVAESSNTPDALQYRHGGGEALPTYEQSPSDFGFRNEIDEPPRYEANNSP